MGDEMAIVVVDDDPSVREYIGNSLHPVSRKVSVFADCWSAWMHIKTGCADLVIADVYMIGMNGFDLLRSVKRTFPKTKCIMISADYSVESRAKELGADAFLAKPFKAMALLGVIENFAPAMA